jgi:hypothetical protein
VRRLLRILLKTLLILGILLAGYTLLQPEPLLGKISFYNGLFPGRERLPFGETPRTAYNFSLSNLNAMFSSHKISGVGKAVSEEIRVVVLGDSSTWGTLLKPGETLAGQLDGKIIELNGTEQTLQVFNLGYPTLSLSKDLLLLNRAMEYQPDLILWPLTMESFPIDKQLATALVADNLKELSTTFQKAGISPQWFESEKGTESWWSRSLFSQRRALWDLIRLQLYGFLWAGTGIDQDYPQDYPKPTIDFQADDTFHSISGVYPDELIAWDVLEAGLKIAGDTPILFINEPMLISNGENSDIRYNFYYPVEAYDYWRREFLNRCKSNQWHCQDYWDILPNIVFTNSAIHYNLEGAVVLSEKLMETIPKLLEQ